MYSRYCRVLLKASAVICTQLVGVSIGKCEASNNYQSSSSCLSRINDPGRKLAIESYIGLVLKNPEFNIKEIPDILEKSIYRSTINLTLDAILYWISYLDGIYVLGHKLRLEFRPNYQIRALPTAAVNHAALHSFVDSLLEEKLVNITWLPDTIEHRFYFNCLLLIFTVLQSFFASTSIEMLGHKLKMEFVASDDDKMLSNTDLITLNHADSQNQAFSVVINEILSDKKTIPTLSKDYLVQHCGVSERVIDELLDELMKSESNSYLIPDVIERQLYRTLYSIILFAIQKITSEMRINLIGDSVTIKLVSDESNDSSPRSVVNSAVGGGIVTSIYSYVAVPYSWVLYYVDQVRCYIVGPRDAVSSDHLEEYKLHEKRKMLIEELEKLEHSIANFKSGK